MTTRLCSALVGTFALILLDIQPALAGPGGRIAKAAFETFWGRIILAALVIVFLPLIIYMTISERLATRRARSDLAFMAAHDRAFAWLDLQQRIKECFQRIHRGWQDGDLSDVSEWMTPWFWQNQQSVYLDQWKSRGLTNVCNVRSIGKVRPLLFVHRNSPDTEHEDSTLVVGITAKMQDYLQDDKSGKVVEGSKKWKDVETVWTFVMSQGTWRVADIEEDSLSLAYARMRKDLPDIQSTLASRLKA